MKNICILSIFCLVASCNIEKERLPSLSKSNSLIIDGLTISDTTYSSIRNLLTLDESIILDEDVPLAKINRVIITENQIFISDSEPKIVCYNHKGKVEYNLFKKGKGVGEFLKIVDFSIDTKQHLLKVYDSSLQKILYYDLTSGAFKFDRKISLALGI